MIFLSNFFNFFKILFFLLFFYSSFVRSDSYEVSGFISSTPEQACSDYVASWNDSYWCGVVTGMQCNFRGCPPNQWDDGGYTQILIIAGCPAGYTQDPVTLDCIPPPALVCESPQVLNQAGDACIDVFNSPFDCSIPYLADNSGACVGASGEPQPPAECLSGVADCYYTSDGSKSCLDFPAQSCYVDSTGWVVVSPDLSASLSDSPLPTTLDLGGGSVAPAESSSVTGGNFNSVGSLPDALPQDFSPNDFSGSTSALNNVDFVPDAPITNNIFDSPSTSSINDLANVNKSIGNLVEDIRFKELSEMIKYLNSIDRTESEIKQYQSQNLAKFTDIRNELGLSRLDDQQFYDLMVNKTDLANDRLADIFRKIDWSSNQLLAKENLSLAVSNKQLLEQKKANQEFSNFSSTASDLLLSTNELKALETDSNIKLTDSLAFQNEEKLVLDNTLQAVQDGNDILKNAVDGTCSPEDVTCQPVGDSGLGDALGLLGAGQLDDGSDINFINDMTEMNLIDDSIEQFKSLFPPLPSPTCSGGIHTTIFSRPFDLEPCSRLAPLRAILAWVFGILVFKNSWDILFRAKG